MNLFKGNDGLVYMERDGDKFEITVKQCFPWSEPGEFLSLRDQKGNELDFVDSISDLPSEQQSLLQGLIELSNFKIEVTGITSIEETTELRHFDVTTRQGERKFQMLLEDYPQVKDDGSIVIKDLSGDLYIIRDIGSLCKHSQNALAPYYN